MKLCGALRHVRHWSAADLSFQHEGVKLQDHMDRSLMSDYQGQQIVRRIHVRRPAFRYCMQSVMKNAQESGDPYLA
jgi:hypothetical protein